MLAYLLMLSQNPPMPLYDIASPNIMFKERGGRMDFRFIDFGLNSEITGATEDSEKTSQMHGCKEYRDARLHLNMFRASTQRLLSLEDLLVDFSHYKFLRPIFSVFNDYRLQYDEIEGFCDSLQKTDKKADESVKNKILDAMNKLWRSCSDHLKTEVKKLFEKPEPQKSHQVEISERKKREEEKQQDSEDDTEEEEEGEEDGELLFTFEVDPIRNSMVFDEDIDNPLSNEELAKSIFGDLFSKACGGVDVLSILFRRINELENRVEVLEEEVGGLKEKVAVLEYKFEEFKNNILDILKDCPNCSSKVKLL